jgi:hypothetical protein
VIGSLNPDAGYLFGKTVIRDALLVAIMVVLIELVHHLIRLNKLGLCLLAIVCASLVLAIVLRVLNSTGAKVLGLILSAVLMTPAARVGWAHRSWTLRTDDTEKQDIDPIMVKCDQTRHRHDYGMDASYWVAMGYYEVQERLLNSIPALLQGSKWTILISCGNITNPHQKPKLPGPLLVAPYGSLDRTRPAENNYGSCKARLQPGG